MYYIDPVMKNHSYAYNLLGQTSVTEVLDIMDLGDVILTNDSGLMHMGRALGKPVATVYGSTSYGLTVPKTGFFRAISLNMSCLCRSKSCPLGHYKCTADISAKHVLDEIEGLYKDAYSGC